MGGRAKDKKKNSRKGKLNKKNSCTPINPKKYSCYGLKKIHTRNLITKKNSCRSKIPLPPPPHNVSNGRSLSRKLSNFYPVSKCGRYKKRRRSSDYQHVQSSGGEGSRKVWPSVYSLPRRRSCSWNIIELAKTN